MRDLLLLVRIIKQAEDPLPLRDAFAGAPLFSTSILAQNYLLPNYNAFEPPYLEDTESTALSNYCPNLSVIDALLNLAIAQLIGQILGFPLQLFSLSLLGSRFMLASFSKFRDGSGACSLSLQRVLSTMTSCFSKSVRCLSERIPTNLAPLAEEQEVDYR